MDKGYPDFEIMLVLIAGAFLFLSIFNKKARVYYLKKIKTFYDAAHQFSEATVFVIVITGLTLVVISPQPLNEFGTLIHIGLGGHMAIGLLFAMIGLSLSLYHAFSNRIASKFELRAMDFYVAFTYMIIAFAISRYARHVQEPGFLLLSLWSSIQGLAYAIMAVSAMNDSAVWSTKRQAQAVELLAGIATVIAVLGFDYVFLQSHWSISFSLVLIVWSFISDALENSNSHSSVLDNSSVVTTNPVRGVNAKTAALIVTLVALLLLGTMAYVRFINPLNTTIALQVWEIKGGLKIVWGRSTVPNTEPLFLTRVRLDSAYEEPVAESILNTRVSDYQAEEGVTYRYRLYTKNPVGRPKEIAKSHWVSWSRPASPTSLSFEGNSWLGTTSLQWAPSTHEDVVGYRIYRSTSSTELGERVAQISTTTYVYHTFGLPADIYYYRVSAVDRADNETYLDNHYYVYQLLANRPWERVPYASSTDLGFPSVSVTSSKSEIWVGETTTLTFHASSATPLVSASWYLAERVKDGQSLQKHTPAYVDGEIQDLYEWHDVETCHDKTECKYVYSISFMLPGEYKFVLDVRNRVGENEESTGWGIKNIVITVK